MKERRPRKRDHYYTTTELAEIAQLRREGKSWNEIASHMKLDVMSVTNAFHRNSKTRQPVDTMPRALRPWPVGVNFRPDELEVRA
jgi:hypothetical protein